MSDNWVSAQVVLVGLDEIEIEGSDVKRMSIQLDHLTHSNRVGHVVQVLVVSSVPVKVIERSGRVLWRQNS